MVRGLLGKGSAQGCKAASDFARELQGFSWGCLAFRGFFFLVNFESFVEEGTTRVEVFRE